MTSHGKQPAHRAISDDVNLTYDVTITGSLGPGVWSCCTLLCWDRRGTFCGGSGASRTSATVALATGAVALVAADPFGVLVVVLVGLVAVLGVETDYHLPVAFAVPGKKASAAVAVPGNHPG